MKLLKFITCGSVDDGKSTLIGHMLYDAKLLFADQEQALKLDSKVGSRGGAIDYSLLLDGLMAEREQGITIDVAYRYFTTERRSFIVADTPGHEEYTRNMAVGASFADLAIILVDATQGVLVQTKRHGRICALMGIRHFVFALNKMDLISYDRERFEELKKEINKLAAALDIDEYEVVPVSATEGDNVNKVSEHMPWYQGKTLLEYLENVEIEKEDQEEGFVLPVQRVCRPNPDFRGFQGQVESGKICVGDEIKVLPSGETARVSALYNMEKVVHQAKAGQAITLQLDKEIDVSRGCVFVKNTELHFTNMFSVTLLWMDDVPLIEGKSFLLKLGTKMVPASIMKMKYKIDVNSGEKISVTRIYKNELVDCEIVTSEVITFDRFSRHRSMGSFILIDRISNMTSGCGIVRHSLRRSENIVWQKLDITREVRARSLGQKPFTLWFTGLSGSGKSTLANEIEKRLCIEGKHTMMLDGDNIRMGLNKNLGFQEKDRIENIRRIAEVARLMNDAGLIVLTSFISPFQRDRQNAREIIGEEHFIEVYISTPLEECEKRDVKGLYKKARSGEIPNFTGISSEYQIPEQPQLTIDTSCMSLDEATDLVMKYLKVYME